MQYIGEHLFPGQLGHFFSVLSLVASLVATIAYFKANRTDELSGKKSWVRIARFSFLLETGSVLGIFASLYYIISNHYHEYYYAWNHSSRSLPLKYILSCFWEGSEGSFLLWSFWHCVLGWVLIKTSKSWEAGVMTVVSFAQFCLASMLIGIYFFGAKVGSNPFILWRQQMPEIPLFSDPNYLQLPRVFEGNDLNTLLQNYWMVIHPPVLFLGFASTIVPFAYAYAGLEKNDHSWVKTSLPWASFSAAVLGTGIMMGAAWAYESLSFGGYWAWDPVENASLVPWITLVAGLHTNLIYKSTGYSLRSTYFFYIITFSLVLYSTFLTRSGILGDTSVHAFTDLGMNTQLLLFLLIFLIPALAMFFYRYKKIPFIAKEESSYSREFWMFIGSLVLFLAAIIIIAKTSVPVFNKLFGTNIAPPEDPEYAYNQIQVFVAIIIGILTAVTQYLKYKDTPNAYFGKKVGIPTLIAIVLSVCISLFGNINFEKKGIGFLAAIHVAIFASVYAIVANASYIWIVMKGKIKIAGASVAHVGFGMVLLGVLLSSSKKAVLSWNTTGVAVFKKEKNEDPAENITLFKTVATDMGKYMVTYARDTFNEKERKRFYEIHFKSKDGKEEFSLYPDIIKNNKGMEGFAANPAAKHYWNKDIFVYISSFQENKPDTASFRNIELQKGDTTFFSNGLVILNKVSINPEEQKAKFDKDETALFLDMTAISKDGRRYPVNPGIIIKGSTMRKLPDTVKAQSLIIQFNKVSDPQTGKLEIGMKESSAVSDLVTLKVYEFPMIIVLWMGVVVMVTGFGMSIADRVKKASLTKV
ncbi:MAG: cytochrome c biogenesis protein CcsA [Bacteroidota bacterium]|nr:cytochrome c biogenesis protein CcsA [Bacteroidota bacterium]